MFILRFTFFLFQLNVMQFRIIGSFFSIFFHFIQLFLIFHCIFFFEKRSSANNVALRIPIFMEYFSMRGVLENILFYLFSFLVLFLRKMNVPAIRIFRTIWSKMQSAFYLVNLCHQTT